MKLKSFLLIVLITTLAAAQNKPDSLRAIHSQDSIRIVNEEQQIQVKMQSINYELQHREAVLQLLNDAKKLQDRFIALQDEKKKLGIK